MKRGFVEKLIGRIQRIQPGDVQNYLLDLARERGFLHTIFNAIQEGVIVTDPEGRVMYLNRAACQFFGLDEESCSGKMLGELVRGLDWSALRESRSAISRDLEVFYPANRLLNFYIVGLDGEEGEGGEGGALAGHAIILRDITETRKSAEETIESERFSALTLLAAGVAHEIGNPLNSLGIHLQLIGRRIGKLPVRVRRGIEESVEVARQEIARLDGIITRFLQAVRPQGIRARPENLNRVIEEAVEFLRPEIRDRDILLELDLDREMPLAQIDPDQLKQAIYNILRNSFQAMKSGGLMRVSTRHDEFHVYASFGDTGGGIPAESLHRIFEPYFTTKEGGSGLGLMIVRRIIRAHGGEIGLHSAEGRGLEVNLRFPRLDRHVRFLQAGERSP